MYRNSSMEIKFNEKYIGEYAILAYLNNYSTASKIM